MNHGAAKGSTRQTSGLLIAGGSLASAVFTGSRLGCWAVGGEGLSDALTAWVPAVALIALGALILLRSDVYRIGLLLGAMVLSVLAAGVTGGLAEVGYLSGDAVGGASWLSWFAAIALLIATFPSGLRNEIDSESVVISWIRVASETMRPVGVGVWVRR